MSATLTKDEFAKALVTASDLTGKMASLYRQIGDLAQQRGGVYAALLATPEVRAMIARGQKTMRSGDFVIEAGTVKNRICACHGAPPDECVTVGDVTIIERESGEPWIKIRPLAAVKTEEAA